MFRQFSYRLIPLVLGLVAGGLDRRGGKTSTEVTDPGLGPGPSSDFDPDFDPPDRGDVPGWVLITLMTAGLVNSALNRQSVIKFLPPRIIAI